MKKVVFAFAPLLIAGFIISNNGNKNLSVNTTTMDSTYDGPYVLYKNDQLFIKNITSDNDVKAAKVDSLNISGKSSVTLTVATDEPENFYSKIER